MLGSIFLRLTVHSKPIVGRFFFTCIEVQGKECDCAPVSSWIQVYPPGSGARSLAPARDSPDGDQESDYQDESQR